MSTAILPDNSVVVRLDRYTVHIDVPGSAIHIRAPSANALAGSIVASYAFSSAARVRVRRRGDGRFRLHLLMNDGTKIDLGKAPSQDVGMMTARAIADVARCMLDAGHGEVDALPGSEAPDLLEAKRDDIEASDSGHHRPPVFLALLNESASKVAAEIDGPESEGLHPLSGDMAEETAEDGPKASADPPEATKHRRGRRRPRTTVIPPEK